MLCIVLKRFCWHINDLAKVDTIVHFPLKGLDLSAHCARKERSALYNLRGVVVHHGQGMQFGHYTAFAYNDMKGATHRQEPACTFADDRAGSWMHYNDSKVSTTTEDIVRRGSDHEPYILFYERAKTTVQDSLMNAEALDL